MEGEYKAGRDARRTITKEIRQIQPQAGKNLKDLEVPKHLFEHAKKLVYDIGAGLRFNKVDVYGLLLGHLGRLKESVEVSAILDGWKLASVSLFRYAVNLLLAPNRIEFKKMKLSTSYYVYNISRHLYRAEKVFLAMGYKQADKNEKKESLDLVYEGDVNIVSVLDTATDLLVMHEEVAWLQMQVGDVPTLQSMLVNRQAQISEACKRAGVDPDFLSTIIEQRFVSDQGGHLHSQSQQPGMFQPGVVDARQQVALQECNAHEMMHQQQNVNPYGGPQLFGAVSQPMPSNQLQGGSSGFMSTSAHSSNQQGEMEGYPPQNVQQPLDQQYIAHNLHLHHPSGQESSITGWEVVPESIVSIKKEPEAELYDLSLGGPWDGRKASPDNPTIFQNVDKNSPPTQTTASGSALNQAHTTQSQADHSPSPPKPTPRPRLLRSGNNQAHQTTPADGEMAQKNIHLMSLEKNQKEGYNKQPSGDEASLNIADTLPPPVTMFSLPTNTPTSIDDSRYDSGFPLSGLPMISGGDSGPQGLKASQMAQYNDQSSLITGPNPPLALRTDSDMSEDIYGSGPAFLGKAQQSISSILEENEMGDKKEWLYSSDSPTSTAIPAGMTVQGSKGQEEHPVPTPRSKKINSRALSVDELENDHITVEDTQAKMRRSKSGNNLKQMEMQAHQVASDITQNLFSPLPSTDCSPSVSPNSRRKRSTHEDWVIVPQASHKPDPSSEEMKIKSLPRQAKSVDRSVKSGREMPRFSSGSNILENNRPPVPDQANIEPQTPVVGKTSDEWISKMKAKNNQEFNIPSSTKQSSAPPTYQQPSSTKLSSAPPTNQQPSSTKLPSAPPTNQQPSSDSTVPPFNKSSPQPSTVTNHSTENKPPLSPYKKKPVIATTKAEASQDTTSDESRVDFYGGESARALRSNLAPGEEYQRKRVNAGPSSKSRPKPSTESDLEKETSFTEKVNETPLITESNLEKETSFTEKVNKAPLITDDSFSALGLWVCDYCTNLNDVTLQLCETCHQVRQTTV